ncbi:hypothetical protein, conserved [Eimeria praecox]|uniref:Uncharacterized protein n=1 Tax=Eimeria praecox TaxID=51316 RepID=U6GT23_9EIME|nr:hypothetical protein, conserved [Eimeria praecox]
MHAKPSNMLLLLFMLLLLLQQQKQTDTLYKLQFNGESFEAAAVATAAAATATAAAAATATAAAAAAHGNRRGGDREEDSGDRLHDLSSPLLEEEVPHRAPPVPAQEETSNDPSHPNMHAEGGPPDEERGPSCKGGAPCAHVKRERPQGGPTPVKGALGTAKPSSETGIVSPDSTGIGNVSFEGVKPMLRRRGDV